MKNRFTLLFLLGLLTFDSACSTTSTARTNETVGSSIQQGAVFAGDYPDPSVIRVGTTYWATATSSAWAPEYPIFSSEDLVNWKLTGAVYQKRPAWTEGNYWAPELVKLGETFYVYYSAKKKGGNMCLGVGSAKAPQGPYTDHDPLICQKVGSIDAMPVVNEAGEKYLFWKEDGNSVKKPTPIWLQKLSADGTKLVGPKKEVMRNDTPWESQLIEGPFVMKRGEYWYMFYSGNACCGRECNYALGVARAKALEGPWEKNPRNPILKGNDVWKCPGHGSIVADAQGRDVLLYHAYHAKDFVYVGRQAPADEVQWQSDAWPTINEGNGPSFHADGFLGTKLRNEEHVFKDEFNSQELIPGWQWPYSQEPTRRLEQTQGGRLLLTPGSLAKAGDPIAAVVARSTTVGDYTAKTVLRTDGLNPGTRIGLSAYGEAPNALGVYFSDGKLIAWKRQRGKHEELSSVAAPEGSVLQLRMKARNGHRFKFEVSADGTNWTAIGDEMDGDYLPPWDLGIRIALTVGGPKGVTGQFESFEVQPSSEQQQR